MHHLDAGRRPPMRVGDRNAWVPRGAIVPVVGEEVSEKLRIE
jgi:hypothetical protein